MIPGPLQHLRHQGVRHCVGEPSLQERRVRRLLRIAGRTYAKTCAGIDGFNARHIELTGTQREPNKRGVR